MGVLFLRWPLPGPVVYRCVYCSVELASPDAIISKDFKGRHGEAYLFTDVVNTTLGSVEERQFISGVYQVNDVYCVKCQQLVGWRYGKVSEQHQKFKEGKYVLERKRLVRHNKNQSQSNPGEGQAQVTQLEYDSSSSNESMDS